MNAVSVIFPYRLEGVWVFDDASAGLVREPFISGADNILDVLTEHIPEAANQSQPIVDFLCCGIAFPEWSMMFGIVFHAQVIHAH